MQHSTEDYLDIYEWQVQAIKEGIAAADRGETVNFEEIKKHWEKKLTNSNQLAPSPSAPTKNSF
jgi:predicted transcriptional regulator